MPASSWFGAAAKGASLSTGANRSFSAPDATVRAVGVGVASNVGLGVGVAEGDGVGVGVGRFVSAALGLGDAPSVSGNAVLVPRGRSVGKGVAEDVGAGVEVVVATALGLGGDTVVSGVGVSVMGRWRAVGEGLGDGKSVLVGTEVAVDWGAVAV